MMSLPLELIAGVTYLIVGALLSRVSLRGASRYSSLMEDGSITLLTSWKTSFLFPNSTFFRCNNMKDWKMGKSPVGARHNRDNILSHIR